MLDTLEKIVDTRKQRPKPGFGSRFVGWSLWVARTSIKRYKDSRPGSHNRPEFQRHRYPEISIDNIQRKVNHFKELLGISEDLKVEHFFGKFFRIRT
jgi:hypothetical protein